MGKRLGRFAMSRQLVERDPETARAIMGRCIVVRCEMMYAYDTLEYVALIRANIGEIASEVAA